MRVPEGWRGEAARLSRQVNPLSEFELNIAVALIKGLAGPGHIRRHDDAELGQRPPEVA